MNRFLYVLVIFFIFVLFVFGMVNFFAVRRLANSLRVCGDKLTSMTNEEKWRVSPSLLTNPMIYEWRGTVKGQLIEKRDHVLVIGKDGGIVEVTDLMKDGTKWNWTFHRIVNNRTEDVRLGDVLVGSYLMGDVWAFRTSPDKLVGGAFRILSEQEFKK